MDTLPEVESLAAAIRNAAWMVRHYQRGARMHCGYTQMRADAILKMGFAVRDAFNRTEHFEPLLVAIVDGLRPRPEEQPF